MATGDSKHNDSPDCSWVHVQLSFARLKGQKVKGKKNVKKCKLENMDNLADYFIIIYLPITTFLITGSVTVVNL